MRKNLPIDALVPGVLDQLRSGANLVIQAPPGAGKTTRVPPALAPITTGEILVLEPRRLAARMAARQVARELGEKLGETVGYQVRFDSVGGPKTRIRFLTEGVLTRRLLSDPRLSGVGVVILDEFHERHLDGDLALALLRRLQQDARSDLRLVVMSATLDTDRIAAFLGSTTVRSEGRLYPVKIRYTPHSPAPLAEQVDSALADLLRDGLDGDVLVFLPGAAEIRRAMRTCQNTVRRADALAVPLHGDLSPAEQDRAVESGPQPKIIFSTNVAESSITIEGVTAVIDSGLARVAEDSPWTGLPSLKVARISQASADQRAGRAGRVRSGYVTRLYPEADYVRRPAHDPPEISRRELTQLCLDLRVLGVADPSRIGWLDPPPDGAVERAESVLSQLGAIDPEGVLTPDGRQMARLPLHPRLARFLIEAQRRGAAASGCRAAGLLSAGERLPSGAAREVGPSDLFVLLEAPLSPAAASVERQLRGLVRPRRESPDSDDVLLIALLTAFPDRVARRRNEDELLLAAGGSANLAPGSVVRGNDLLIALDIEERREKGRPLVRLASAVRPEWLFDLFPEHITERNSVEWNRQAERVDAASALLFDQIAIEETRSGTPDATAAAAMLAEKAWESGIGRFADAEQLAAYRHRIDFAAQYSALKPITDDDLRDALRDLCQGLRSFRDLESAARKGGLTRALRRLQSGERKTLDEVAPERIRLPGGRQARVHYDASKPPWLASRLQDFFGMKETPRIARGKVPLVLHLLAPNQRPVQTTTDLAGFWERLYPQVRRELRRRYPKHAWPENPG